MATNTTPETIRVAIEDQGYTLKGFRIFKDSSVKVLIDSHCRYLCPACTRRETLEFFYQSTKLSDHRVRDLGIVDGDYIDVRPKTECTRGNCPLPVGQTLPNIHYLARAEPLPATELVPREAIALKIETANIPLPPTRVEVTIENWDRHKTVYKLKTATKMEGLLADYNILLGYEPKTLRFFLEGQRVLDADTASELDPEGDGVFKLDVFLPATGGC